MSGKTTVTYNPDSKSYKVSTYGMTHTIHNDGKDYVVKGEGGSKKFFIVSDAVKHLSAAGHRDLHPKHFAKLHQAQNEDMKMKKKGASPEEEEKFHQKLDKLVHKTFGKGKHEIKEDHFKVGDMVKCKDSGMVGKVVKLDYESGEDEDEYYTVARSDGKRIKYAPKDLMLMKEAIERVSEDKDEEEYGNEGEMAMTQLKTIMRACKEMMDMLDDDTDLPEWVQAKITLATDYIQTSKDYLASELDEEVISFEEAIHEETQEIFDEMVDTLSEEYGQIDEVIPLIAGAALRAVAPTAIRAAGGALGRLGTRAGVSAAGRLGVNKFAAARVGKKLGTGLGRDLAASAASSAQDRIDRMRQQRQEDVSIQSKGNYKDKLSKKVGAKATKVNTKPEINIAGRDDTVAPGTY